MNRSVNSGIHSIEAEDHRTFDLSLSVSLSAAQQSKAPAGTARRKSVHRIQKRQEESPERREDGETRRQARHRHDSGREQQNKSQDRDAEEKVRASSPRNVTSGDVSYLDPENTLEDETCRQRQNENSQIQFHSKPAKAMLRDGYCTSIDWTAEFFGKAGSAETKIRSQNLPAQPHR